MTIVGCLAPMIVALSTLAPGDGARLLDQELRLAGPTLGASTDAPDGAGATLAASDADFSGSTRSLAFLVAAAEGSGGSSGVGGAAKQGSKPSAESPPAQPPSLDFDLLGAPQKAVVVDQGALERRRTMLTWHQGVGLGMFALQLATTVVGQLNYTDKFGGDNTGKYVQPHAILAFSTLAAFAAAGTLALLAPKPIQRDEGFDRVSLHKWSMFVATAGMVAQGALGIWAQSREGYLNQQGIATAHLVIGYVTLAAVTTGVSALVF